uniref:Uncharacterized protein n=1 Tax=Strongyloides venezuelensis TaxID=75913 RepID=A0A0K0F0Y0_STRVS
MKNSLDKWKLNNNAIEDKNFLNTNRNFPSIILASKCVLNANVEEIFNTTKRGQQNSETFVEQILQYNSNDYIQKYPDKAHEVEKNEKIAYSKNSVIITATNTTRSHKHYINYLMNEAGIYYSNKKSSLLSPKTKLSLITFITPELYYELSSVKNNLVGPSKTVIKNSLFFNTFFNLKDIGSFKCDEIYPNMILPEYKATILSKLENNNIDPSLMKGILIQPKSRNELDYNQEHIDEMFIVKLHFLLSKIVNIKKKDTFEAVFENMFTSYPRDIDLSSKFWSIPLNEILKLLPKLFKEQFTKEMKEEFENFKISCRKIGK